MSRKKTGAERNTKKKVRQRRRFSDAEKKKFLKVYSALPNGEGKAYLKKNGISYQHIYYWEKTI